MVELLDKGTSVVNHTSLSNYAFLYGVFPVAPGVAIFATQFNMEVEIVCMHCFFLSRGGFCGEEKNEVVKCRKQHSLNENLSFLSCHTVNKEIFCNIMQP